MRIFARSEERRVGKECRLRADDTLSLHDALPICQLSRNLLVKFAVANGLLADIAPGLTYDPKTDLLATDTAIDAQRFDEALTDIAAASGNEEAVAKQGFLLTALVEIDPTTRTDLLDAVGRFVSGYDDVESLLPAFENPVFEHLDIDLNLGSSDADSLYGDETGEAIVGFGGNDRLYGRAGDDALYGNEGDDSIHGESGNDILDGGDGRDELYGGDGDDTLRGGTGSGDYLRGDAGDDTYRFGAGDGNTRVYNYDRDEGRNDVLRLLEGIEASDVRATRSSNNLLLTVGSTGEVITVSNYFYGDAAYGYQLDAIEFADGTVWDVDTVKGLVLQGSEGADTLSGFATDDTLNGLGGDDRLYGADGNDTLSGGAGNDNIQGQDGNDILDGGDGRDYLYGGDGDDTLRGGAGSGDYLSGEAGNDTYRFGAGDGNTTVNNYDRSKDRNDVLQFLEGIEASDVTATRSRNDLLLTVGSTGEVITVSNYFYGDAAYGYQLDSIEFADGTMWDVDTVKGLVLQGSEGADTLSGFATDDTLNGLGGDDRLYGADGNDTLSGGAGNDNIQGQDGNDILDGGDGRDYLYGGDGDDTLRGGTGSGDYLSGEAGNDTYRFGAGDGNTRVYNYDANAASVDTARFEDVTIEDLWFSRSGSNLQITVAGTDDQVTISNWHSNSNYQVDRIEAGSSVLLNSQVEQLVSAMASYSVPSGAGNVIPQDVKDELQPILAETWQTA